MARITFADFKLLCRQLADMEANTPADHFVADVDELDDRANEALSDLRDLVIEVMTADYYRARHTFTTVANQSAYPLPKHIDEFAQLTSVYLSDGDQSSPMDPWQPQEEAGLRNYDAYRGDGLHDYRYQVSGEEIHLLPVPKSSSYTVTMTYIPDYAPLKSPNDYFKCPYGWWKWAALRCAIDLVNKEEGDVSGLIMQMQVKEASIRKLASRRDAGRPRVAQDTRRDRYGRRRPYDWAKTV